MTDQEMFEQALDLGWQVEAISLFDEEVLKVGCGPIPMVGN